MNLFSFFSVSEPYLIVWNDTGFGTGVLVNGLELQETVQYHVLSGQNESKLLWRSTT